MKIKIQEAVLRAYQIANEKLSRDFQLPKVCFDLRGTTAGVAYPTLNKLNFNIPLAVENESDFLERTCKHEVSHLIAPIYFNKPVKAHGYEWKYIMVNVFGLFPHRCHAYSVSNHVCRKTKLHIYKCSCCHGVKVGAKHHKIIQTDAARVISCRTCRVRLTPSLYLKSVDRHAANV